MKSHINIPNVLNSLQFYIDNPINNKIVMHKIHSLFKVLSYSHIYNFSIRISCFHNDVSKSSFYRWLDLFLSDVNSLKNSSTRPNNQRNIYNWDILDPYINRLLNNTKRFYRINLPTIATKINKKFNLNISIPTLYKHCSKRIYKVKKKKVSFNRRYEVMELGHIQMDGLNINNPNLVNKKGTKFHIFTAIDQHSRFAFSYCYDEKCRSNAIDFSNKAIAYFKDKGIDVIHIRTDNGSEFVHTKSRWMKNSKHRIVSGFEINLSRQFITFDTTKPSTPQHNGKIERFNRTLRLDFIFYLEQTKSNLSIEEINKKLAGYIKYYNFEKYHNTLKKTPNEVLQNYLQFGEINEHIVF